MWIPNPNAMPSAVNIPAARPRLNACCETSTKSGPGDMHAKKCTPVIIQKPRQKVILKPFVLKEVGCRKAHQPLRMKINHQAFTMPDYSPRNLLPQAGNLANLFSVRFDFCYMTSIFIIPKETPVFLIPRFAQYIPSLVQTVTGADGFACCFTLKRTQHTRIMLTAIGIHAPALVFIPRAIH